MLVPLILLLVVLDCPITYIVVVVGSSGIVVIATNNVTIKLTVITDDDFLSVKIFWFYLEASLSKRFLG